MQTDENKQNCSLLRAGKCDQTLTFPPTISIWAQKKEQNQRPTKSVVTQGVPVPAPFQCTQQLECTTFLEKRTRILWWSLDAQVTKIFSLRDWLLHTEFSWIWENLAKQWGAGGELNVKAMALNPQLHMVFSSTGTSDVRIQDLFWNLINRQQGRQEVFSHKETDSTECCGLREDRATGQPRVQAGTNNWALTHLSHL